MNLLAPRRINSSVDNGVHYMNASRSELLCCTDSKRTQTMSGHTHDSRARVRFDSSSRSCEKQAWWRRRITFCTLQQKWES